MEKSQMRNIVVLKNLPSNLVEEAIVILKSNKIARKFEYIDKKDISKKDNNKNTKDYIIREAESVISSYINSVERKETKTGKKIANQRYKGLKIYSVIITILLLIFIIV